MLLVFKPRKMADHAADLYSFRRDDSQLLRYPTAFLEP
jgi:hypothetical protein